MNQYDTIFTDKLHFLLYSEYEVISNSFIELVYRGTWSKRHTQDYVCYSRVVGKYLLRRKWLIRNTNDKEISVDKLPKMYK